MTKPFVSALLSASFIAPLLVAGCGQPEEAPPGDDLVPVLEGEDGKADAFDSRTDPRALLSLVNNVGTLRADTLVPAGSVGRAVSVPDDSKPYSDTYWPMTSNGINMRWQGQGELAPSEKYAKLFLSAEQGKQMTDWIQKNHGKDVPGVQGWFGICQGWTGASINEKMPLKKIAVKKYTYSGRTYLGLCSAAEIAQPNGPCVSFETGDLTGLLAESYSAADARFVGYRCDTAAVNFRYDGSGRIQQPNCRSNAGTLFLAATNFIGKGQRAFAINAVNNDEVWNQPAFSYTISRYDTVSEADAAKAVDATKTRYEWNTAARGFRRVTLTLTWAVESYGPPTGQPQTRSAGKTYDMIVELDASGNVIGGEWIGSSKNDHPPFFWAPVAAGTEVPYLRPSYVRALVSLSRR